MADEMLEQQLQIHKYHSYNLGM